MSTKGKPSAKTRSATGRQTSASSLSSAKSSLASSKTHVKPTERGLRSSSTKPSTIEENDKKALQEVKGNQLDKLCSMLQEACDELSDPSKRQTMQVEGKAVAKRVYAGDEKKIENAILNAYMLIDLVGASRGTNAIKSKVKEKQSSEAVQKATEQGNSKITVVEGLLTKFHKQVDEGKFDETEFTQSKFKDPRNEEIKKCRVHILDCCRKLKNANDERMRITDIVEWINKLHKQTVEGKYDEKAFSKSKPKDGSNDEINKCHEHIVDCCRKLKNANEELLSENNRKNKEMKEVQKQDQTIREIWTMINPSKKPIEKDIKVLDEIKEYVSETQRQLNIGKNESEIERKEMQNQEQAVKDLLAIIKTDKNTSDKVNLAVAFDDIKTYIQQQQDELDRIEKHSNKVEETSFKILQLLAVVPETHINEHKTSAGVLESALEMLKRCESETFTCIEEIKHLELVLNINNSRTSISQRCQLATKKAQDFQQSYVKREQFDKVNDENARMREEMKQLQSDKDSAYNRLSKVASARLTENNPNIADLSDENRPTKLAEQFSELYDSQWTDVFEILSKRKKENECINFLLDIIIKCYELCGNLSKNHQLILKRAVVYPSINIEAPKASKKKKKNENSFTFSAVQSKALSELRKQTADISVDNIISVIRSDHKEWFESKELESYTIRCVQLCWLMHVQTPPLVLDKNVNSGSPLDTNKYRHYTKSGKKIDFVVWPVLLLQENGAVLCKGVAQGK